MGLLSSTLNVNASYTYEPDDYYDRNPINGYFEFINSEHEEGTDMTLGSLPLNGRTGTSITIDGTGAAYCVQKGIPLRSKVSDLQMSRVYWDSIDGYIDGDITVADYIRQKLKVLDFNQGVMDARFFVGWGKWALNDDATNAYPLPYENGVTTNDPKFIPSSGVIIEEFDKEGIDTEDQHTGTIGATSFNAASITGHEGAKPTYEAKLREATPEELGLEAEDTNALAILNYYIFKDTDAASFSDTAKRQVMQAFAWAIEWDFVNARTSWGTTSIVFSNSNGKTVSNSMSGNVSCDTYIQGYIGNQYEAMKLYRQVVWKVSNMRTIPEFAYDRQSLAENNPIKLRWDANESAYIATISDSNGVAKYFDFNINGVTFTDNGDGTITVKSPNAINGVLTTPTAASSKLLPSDCEFSIPIYYKWNLEGLGGFETIYRVVFRYSYLSYYNRQIVDEDGSNTSEFVHLHGYDSSRMGEPNYTLFGEDGYYNIGCNWYCEREWDEVTDCIHINCSGINGTCLMSTDDNCQHSCSYTTDGKLDEYKYCGHTTCLDTEYGNCNGVNNKHSCMYNTDCYWECACCYRHDSYNYDHNCDKAECWCSAQSWGKKHNSGQNEGSYNVHEHTDSCRGCTHTHTDSCRGCTHTHTNACYKYYCKHNGFKKGDAYNREAYRNPIHDSQCYHYWNCPSWNKDNTKTTYPQMSTNALPNSKCFVYWYCDKIHYKIGMESFYVKYVDWQDIISFSDEEIKLVDPVNAYVAVETEPHSYPCESDVQIQLIDGNGNVANHIKVGEQYKLRYTYTYNGASKGTTIVKTTTTNKTYYQFTYLTRMTTTSSLYDLRSTATTVSNPVPYQYYVANLFNVSMRGTYTTGEQGENDNIYPNATYKFDSQNLWNDSIKLNPYLLSADEIKNSSTNAYKKSVTVNKVSDELVNVTWVYETPYEVFTSGLVKATAYINVGGDQNYAGADYEEAYNYGEYEDHNYVGDTGLFTGTELYTKNAEGQTYSVKNAFWQSDLDITVDNVILNTGAGITEPTFSDVGTASHWVNYNLYYTVKVNHPEAHYYTKKLQFASYPCDSTGYANGYKRTTEDETYNTTSDKYEFDINTFVDWNATNISGFDNANSEIVYVDHIRSGETYLQKEIPANLPISTSNGNMEVDVNVNYDKLIYEDEYSTPTYTENSINSIFTITLDDLKYDNNSSIDNDVLYPTINPNTNKPFGIVGNGDYDTLTQFSMVLANGQSATISDRNTKNYTMYDFTFNTSDLDNKVTFGSNRNSVTFFKYSNTNYTYNDKSIKGAIGTFKATDTTQTEKYYISEILFKSNYTTNRNYGNNGWVDMVDDNDKAIVSAGQGFEIQVTVRYENSFLTKYLARYMSNATVNGTLYTGDDAKASNIGSSTDKGPQYCNISALTYGTTNIYTNGSILGSPTLDRLAAKLITGSNVYADLYCYMSDNEDAVYSALGQYDTPVIFERKVTHSSDLSAIEFVYTMKKSETNGVQNNTYSKKFYTSQLAPDADSPGVVQNNNLPNGTHSITFWTPIVAATGFDYPSAIQDRYIGDSIEIGYSIKSTGADDNIVHIVQ